MLNMGNEEKKGKERLADIWQKASVVGKDLGKKVADGVQTGTKSLMESAQNTRYSLRMRMYNPVFPKQYKSKNFNRQDKTLAYRQAVKTLAGYPLKRQRLYQSKCLCEKLFLSHQKGRLACAQ